MYVPMEGSAGRLEQLFVGAYAEEPFIVLRGSAPPELREVRGTNRCAIGWHWDETTGRAVVVTATNLAFVSYACDPARNLVMAIGACDNLGKGAAGQAVQCLNVLLGLPETTGLEAPALVP